MAYNFSFIIPHKNIPDLLVRCVTSIPRRDDIQIIIVDDNSDSDKVDFENFPFADDKNVEIIFDKSGKGAGYARNIGIDNAKGKWLVFADADDFFFFSIKKALDIAINSDADIIFFKSNNIDNVTYLTLPFCEEERSHVTNGRVDDFLNKKDGSENLLRFNHSGPWPKFTKKSLVVKNNIRFDETERFNDFKYTYLCGFYAKNIEAYNLAVYCVTSRTGNISSTYNSNTQILFIRLWFEFTIFMYKHNLQNTPSCRIGEKNAFLSMAILYFTDKIEYNRLLNEYLNLSVPNRYIVKNIYKYRIIILLRRFKSLINNTFIK